MKNYIGKNFKILKLVKHDSIAVLTLLIIIAIIFETLSIGMILPLFSSLIDGSFTDKFPFLIDYLNIIIKLFWKNSNLESNQILIFSMVVLFALIFTLRHFFILLSIWKKNIFEYRLKIFLTKYFLSNYLKMPFSFLLKRNTSYLIRNVQTEVEIFSQNILTIISMIGDILTIISLLTLLFFVEFEATLYILLALILVSYGIYFFTKKRIFTMARERQEHSQKSLQYIRQIFAGIREVKLFNREKQFTGNFINSFGALGWIAVIKSMIYIIPRTVLELAIFLILCLFLFNIIFGNVPNSEIFPILALYAGAAFRLMPYVNKLITGSQQIKFAAPSVNLLHSELLEIEKNRIENSKIIYKKQSFEKKIELSEISFSYDSKKIFENTSLYINKGDCIGIIGESGSGKSTLIDIISGLRSPQKGKILVDGEDINKNLTNWQKLIGYVPQNIFILDESIKNNIAFGLENEKIDEKKVLDSIDKSGLNDFFKNNNNNLDANIGEKGSKLSGGQIQRIGIARALYNQTPILIFDESTSSLDDKTEKKILSTLEQFKKFEKTIIIVSHRISTLYMCNKIIKINNKNFERIK
tara:strand:+ start:447 stop:2198 length:1752 start_codon:yes stop_codon:yes gene_type:complete